MNFVQITPFMHVRDLGKALEFFVGVLGFKTLFRTSDYAYVHRETVGIRLLQDEEAHPAPPPTRRLAYYVDVRDVDRLYEELKPRVASLPGDHFRGPMDQHYGQREIHLVLPDGQVIAFGQAIGKARSASTSDTG